MAAMAEGDTILRLARRFDSTLAGHTVSARTANPRGRAAGIERLNGLTLKAATARGKHLLLDFGELSLHSHLGMSGGWHFYRRGAPWRRPRPAAWAVLSGGGWDAVQFGGPTLRVLPTRSLRREPQLAELGPDLLAEDFDLSGAIRKLRSRSELALGEALLNQSLVAGIGNIFKSEACFAAGLSPLRRVGDLSEQELATVLSAARSQMQRSVAGERRPGAVYKRQGRRCPRCGTRIAAGRQGDGNRSTYWCPRCQPEPARVAGPSAQSPLH